MKIKSRKVISFILGTLGLFTTAAEASGGVENCYCQSTQTFLNADGTKAPGNYRGTVFWSFNLVTGEINPANAGTMNTLLEQFSHKTTRFTGVGACSLMTSTIKHTITLSGGRVVTAVDKTSCAPMSLSK